METPPELTKAQRHDANSLLHAAGMTHEVELPEWMALGIEAQDPMLKGAGHKYIRRVPKSGGGYRYFYRVSGGKGGVGHESEFEVGAAFRVKDAGKEGHFHITGKADDGTLTIKHDETGASHTLSPSALRSMLHTEHAEAIGAHKDKIAQDLKDAKESGATPKQVARLEAEADKYGVKTQATQPAPTASHLSGMGFKRWTTASGHDRWYAPDELVRQAHGLDVEFYKTGNVFNATLNGEKISNNKASDLVDQLRNLKLHWDAVHGRWGILKGEPVTEETPRSLNIVRAIEKQMGADAPTDHFSD